MDNSVHGMASRPLGPAAPASVAQTSEVNSTRRERLARATQGFEALFLSYLVKSMHTDEGVFSAEDAGDAGSGLLREVADEQLAQALASRGGIGLGSMLMTTLAARLDAAQAAPGAADVVRPAAEKVNEP
jgi:Rod binding domain-containing protein